MSVKSASMPLSDSEIARENDVEKTAFHTSSFVDIHGLSDSFDRQDGGKFCRDVVTPIVDNFADFDAFATSRIDKCVKCPVQERPWKPTNLSSEKAPPHLLIECCDLHILHNERDLLLAKKMQEDIIAVLKLHGIDISVRLFADLFMITNKMDRFEYGMKRAAYTFIFLTENFYNKDFDQYMAKTLLYETICDINRRDTVVPVYVDEFRRRIPSLNVLNKIRYMTVADESGYMTCFTYKLSLLFGGENTHLAELNRFNRRCLDQERNEWIIVASRALAEQMKKESEHHRQRCELERELNDLQKHRQSADVNVHEKTDEPRNAHGYLSNSDSENGISVSGSDQWSSFKRDTRGSANRTQPQRMDPQPGQVCCSHSHNQAQPIYAENVNIINNSTVHVGKSVKLANSHDESVDPSINYMDSIPTETVPLEDVQHEGRQHQADKAPDDAQQGGNSPSNLEIQFDPQCTISCPQNDPDDEI